MAQSKEFVDGSHALNDLSHVLAMLESKNASLQGAVDGCIAENAKLRELAKAVTDFVDGSECDECSHRRHCEDNNRMFCGDELSYHAFYRMREELGIEVDG